MLTPEPLIAHRAPQPAPAEDPMPEPAHPHHPPVPDPEDEHPVPDHNPTIGDRPRRGLSPDL